MRKEVKIIISILLILIIVIFTVRFIIEDYINEKEGEDNIITNNEQILDDTREFRVECRNNGNTSHIVVLIILDENNTEIHNSTTSIKPGDNVDLYKHNLTYKVYTTKVIVDNYWTNSTKQVPASFSWRILVLNYYGDNEHLLSYAIRIQGGGETLP